MRCVFGDVDFERPELHIFAQTLRKTLEAAKRSNGAEKPRVLHF